MSRNGTNTIYFYSHKGEYGFLSNFYPAPITICGVEWPTSEHFFQAAKFFYKSPTHQNHRDICELYYNNTAHSGNSRIFTEYIEKIRTDPSPANAKKYGGIRTIPIDPRWEDIKDRIMTLAVTTKFEHHRDLADKIISTYPSPLVEHTVRDRYWADGGDGSGKNMLGQILMDVRSRLIQHSEQPPEKEDHEDSECDDKWEEDHH